MAALDAVAPLQIGKFIPHGARAQVPVAVEQRAGRVAVGRGEVEITLESI